MIDRDKALAGQALAALLDGEEAAAKAAVLQMSPEAWMRLYHAGISLGCLGGSAADGALQSPPVAPTHNFGGQLIGQPRYTRPEPVDPQKKLAV